MNEESRERNRKLKRIADLLVECMHIAEGTDINSTALLQAHIMIVTQYELMFDASAEEQGLEERSDR